MEPTATLAEQCSILVAGFQPKTNKQIALASYTFTPPVNPTSSVPMQYVKLPDEFSQPLYNITFIMDNKLAALLIDNTHYNVSTT